MASLTGNITIKTTEMHTEGDAVRIVEAGYPDIQGKTVLEKREYLNTNLDANRRLLMYEPRGYAALNGALLVAPDDKDAVTGVVFMDNDEYGTACGHVTIALGRYLIDKGFIKNPISPETEVKMQCPSGNVTVVVEYENGKTGYSKFRNVPAYVASHETIDVGSWGRIEVDLCFGGAFYAVVSASAIGYEMSDNNMPTLLKAAYDIYVACQKQIQCVHDIPDLAYVLGVMLIEERDDRTMSLSMFGCKQPARSPCGSGTTAIMSLQHSLGRIQKGKSRIYQNALTKSQFIGTVVEEYKRDNKPDNIIVEIQGRSYYTGTCSFTLEENDVLGRGILV